MDKKVIKSESFVYDHKIPNDVRMQMPLIEDQYHQIIAVGNLYIAKAYNQHIEIKKLEMNNE